jgi:F-type H+-transporting ATPase subunit delta
MPELDLPPTLARRRHYDDDTIRWLPLADDSRASDVGARYARALFDLCVETGVLDAVEADLKSLGGMIAGSADFRALLASPRFSGEDKAKGLSAIAARAGLSETTAKFLGVLAANRRAGALGPIIQAFGRLVEAHRGVISAHVVTAIPLSAAQTETLTAALRASFGKDPRIETHVDPAILGGLRVRVGSRLYDASLKSKLDSLKFALKRA